MSGDTELEELLEAALEEQEDEEEAEAGEQQQRGQQQQRSGSADSTAVPPAKRTKTARGACPPHPGFMGDICIRCGEVRSPTTHTHAEAADRSGAVALRYIHHSLEVSQAEAERVREDTAQRALAARRLLLVLDLDHTLLNSTHFSELTEEGQRVLEEHLAQQAGAARGPEPQPAASQTGLSHSATPAGERGLFCLAAVHMWTKLRPGVRAFLEAAHAQFDLHVYTMGDKAYAAEMARLLDPSGRLFQGRIISAGDSTRRGLKDLDVVLGMPHMALVLDDTEAVWPRYRRNLVLVDRYIYFPACARRFGAGQSLMERHSDEAIEGGALSNVLRIIQAAHARFFATGAPCDVRLHLDVLRRQVLGPTCCLLFSRIIPLGAMDPAGHPLWRLAVELGARCVLNIQDDVTHVVASSITEKTRWAKEHGKHVVNADWLLRSAQTWTRAAEACFQVTPAPASGPGTAAAAVL